jgi:glyoxylate/hydroxypyruvate reductase
MSEQSTQIFSVPTGPLTIVVVNPNVSRRRWADPLALALPQHTIVDSREEHDPGAVDVAVVGWIGDTDLGRYARLQLIQSLWMGADRLIENPAIPANVPLTRMVDPGMPISMAETVMAHVLAAHRRLDDYARYQREARWRTHRQPLASARTVAVLGLGELGSRCAQSLRGLGFRVVGWSRSGSAVEGIEVSTDLETTLAQSEIVVNLLPLTPQTQGLFCAQTFSMMPPGAVFINVGRGAHVVDEDLLAALASGHLRHCVLDVFNEEPLPAEHPYWLHPQVTATPHIAAESEPATCVPVIAENVRRLTAGEPFLHLVDRQLGY